MLDKQSKIYVAVHNGLEGSAILNILLPVQERAISFSTMVVVVSIGMSMVFINGT